MGRAWEKMEKIKEASQTQNLICGSCRQYSMTTEDMLTAIAANAASKARRFCLCNREIQRALDCFGFRFGMLFSNARDLDVRIAHQT